MMKTLFIGQNTIHLNSADSTNSYAAELLRQNNIPEGSIIYTFEQLKGKGQRGTVWESEPHKNVTLSMVLYPKFLYANKQYLLTKITSLAVADLMTELLDSTEKTGKIKIKWPNDVYIGEKKIAGILIENTLRDNIIYSSIIGIGININQTSFLTTEKSTSLGLLTNKEFELIDVIEKLCSYMEARYLQLKANKLGNIDFEYLQRLYKLNNWSPFMSNNELFEGKILGVADSGKLEVQLNSGVRREFDLKEIKFI